MLASVKMNAAFEKVMLHEILPCYGILRHTPCSMPYARKCDWTTQSQLGQPATSY